MRCSPQPLIPDTPLNANSNLSTTHLLVCEGGRGRWVVRGLGESHKSDTERCQCNCSLALFSLLAHAVSSASFLHDPSHWNSFIQAVLPQSNHLSSRCAPLFSGISHLFCANPSPIRRSGQGSFLTIQTHTLPLRFVVDSWRRTVVLTKV